MGLALEPRRWRWQVQVGPCRYGCRATSARGRAASRESGACPARHREGDATPYPGPRFRPGRRSRPARANRSRQGRADARAQPKKAVRGGRHGCDMSLRDNLDEAPGTLRFRHEVPIPGAYAVFDCETTGTAPAVDEIVSLAAIRVD